MQGRWERICEIVLNVHRANDDEIWHSNTKFRVFKIWDYKRLVQGKRGEIYEIILNVYWRNFDEVWQSNRKLRITKIAHWKIYRWKEGKLEELVAKVLGLRWSLSNKKLRRSDMAQ